MTCWDSTTLGDELEKKGLSWACYGTSYSGSPGMWSAYQAIKHIYHGSDWSKDVISQPLQFLTDVANGNLRSVSWVTPMCANSDHAGCGWNTGPSWVTLLANAVGESKYWDSTAIFITWDDYGGWYDPVAPKYVDYDGLGLRLPMLIISPYVKQGYVSKRALRARQLTDVCGRPVWLGQTSGQRQARELGGGRRLQLLAGTAPI